MTDNLPTIYTKDLIREIALDIGKETVFYIENMYPEAFKAVPKSAKLSVRNHIYNQIMAAVAVNEEGAIIARLRNRKEHRRYIKKLQSAKSIDEVTNIIRNNKP